jgi:hypothetical protein
MQNERNGTTSVHGNGTMNTLISVLCTGLLPLHEMLRRHVLDIFCPYSLRDV